MTAKRAEFDQLVRRLSPELYRFAWWLCHNEAQAQDLVQESFLRAWRSLADLRDEKAAKAWLMTIVRREHARMYERKVPPLDDIADVVVEDRDNPSAHELSEIQQMREGHRRATVGGDRLDLGRPLLHLVPVLGAAVLESGLRPEVLVVVEERGRAGEWDPIALVVADTLIEK